MADTRGASMHTHNALAALAALGWAAGIFLIMWLAAGSPDLLPGGGGW